MSEVKEYCCGRLMEYKDTEWAKFGMSDDEELVSVYKCSKCGNEVLARDRKEIVRR